MTAPAVQAAPAASVLRLDMVQRRHHNGRGVGPLTLSIDAGECVGLMGPNGAGKTTLLRLLASLDRPQRGTLRWFGGMPAVRARRHIGFAADTAVEEASLTARQSTHFWARQWPAHDGVADRVARALSAFGLAAVADEPVLRFSFGMRRRLALAQAFVHEPSLVLLDEPTAGLDPEGVEALRTVLSRRRMLGETAVIASNDCDFMAAACDRVVFLDSGRVVRDATPAALLAEVGTLRRAELELAQPCDPAVLRGLPGVVAVEEDDGATLTVQLDGDAALAGVVAVADRPGGNLRSLRVRVPDLGDAFRKVTGMALEAEASR